MPASRGSPDYCSTRFGRLVFDGAGRHSAGPPGSRRRFAAEPLPACLVRSCSGLQAVRAPDSSPVGWPRLDLHQSRVNTANCVGRPRVRAGKMQNTTVVVDAHGLSGVRQSRIFPSRISRCTVHSRHISAYSARRIRRIRWPSWSVHQAFQNAGRGFLLTAAHLLSHEQDRVSTCLSRARPRRAASRRSCSARGQASPDPQSMLIPGRHRRKCLRCGQTLRERLRSPAHVVPSCLSRTHGVTITPRREPRKGLSPRLGPRTPLGGVTRVRLAADVAPTAVRVAGAVMRLDAFGSAPPVARFGFA
jgi:hypothetical protein